MSLICYECQRAEHAHEIRQFGITANSLYEYFDGRDETALFIGNVNIGEANLDGLIIKSDAIILVEFKDYAGSIIARQNGPWTCDGKSIKGGAGEKTVFEQLRKNQRILKRVIAENNYFSDAQRHDVKVVVVFSDLVSYSDDFDRTNKSWIYVTDVNYIGNVMHDIISSEYKEYKTGISQKVYISENDIFNFIRKLNIDESALVLNCTDTSILPADLFNKDRPHNGKQYSTATLLKEKTLEAESYKSQIDELKSQLSSMEVEFNKKINEKDSLINQQKAELLDIKSNNLKDSTIIQSEASFRDQVTPIDSVIGVNAPQTVQHELVLKQSIITNNEDSGDTLLNHTNLQDPIEFNSELPLVDGKQKRRFGLKERVLKDFNIAENSLDAEQIGLIDRELSKSMIVSGCAGSGKSVIALYKAQQIMDEGGNVIMVALTKSLKRYMDQGDFARKFHNRFFYHWEWVNAKKPSADYIIVDEVQDFTKDEINDFINAARKCFFFFGDSAQSIYGNLKKTVSIKDLSLMTGIPISYLNSNYRLPKSVAKITQPYVAVEASPYADGIYQSKEREIPHFVKFDNDEAQIKAIIDIVRERKMKNVGILVPDNDKVLSIMESFNQVNFSCEFKYNAGYNHPDNRNTLNFTTQYPKLMTYHSAKGLQFEAVFLPLYEGANSIDSRKKLYVAMTRTYRFLYVFYSGDALKAPLNQVPEYLYSKTI